MANTMRLTLADLKHFPDDDGKCYRIVDGVRWTLADLQDIPDEDDGIRYEIIDGELYVSSQPSLGHQVTCMRVTVALDLWNGETRAGCVVPAPGVIFADDDNVAPDIVWVSNESLATAVRSDGKLHAAPELVVEVLSPGATNVRRDRDAKLKLYGRRGVREYWIFIWQRREVEVYRRAGADLLLAATLAEDATLESPVLPGFSCVVRDLFAGIPAY